MWTSRLPHREHVSRPHQSRTVVRAPRRRACSAGAGSTRCGARLAPHDEPNLGHAVSRAAHTDPALRSCIVHPNFCPHRRPFCLSAPSSSSWRSPGCASVAAEPGQAPNAPYQQADPRDTSGMH
jgi:hypothetical protein